jgi:hypothetical protein
MAASGLGFASTRASWVYTISSSVSRFRSRAAGLAAFLADAHTQRGVSTPGRRGSTSSITWSFNAGAYAGHTHTTYIKADLPAVATALAAMTCQPHSMANL